MKALPQWACSWRWLPFVVFIVLALFLWRGLSLDPHQLPATQIGQALPVFDLPSVLGPEQPHLTSQALRGQVSLLIVWASWCEACQEEQILLFQLARQGVALYGLNYKDDQTAAQKWLAEWGNPYRNIGQDPEGKLALDLGVYGTPETYLIDKQGVIQYRYPGVLTAGIWQKEFLPKVLALRREK